MRHFLTFTLFIFVNISYGQEFSYPSINIVGKTIQDFAPVGWIVFDSTLGDLNHDGLTDAAIVLQYKDSISLVNREGDTVLSQPRIFLILFQEKGYKNFQLKEQSNSFILRHDNPAMNDPFEELAITKGVLKIKFNISYNMGSWYTTNAAYKFRYQQGQFVLIGADNDSFHRATHDYEYDSYNFLSKKRTLTKGNENKGTRKSISKSLSVSGLKTFKTFVEPFTWEVEKDVFL